MSAAPNRLADSYETIHTSRARGFPRASFTHGNDVRLYRSGSSLFPRMLEVIRNARETVNLEVYIFRDDSIGRRFVEALTEAARKGITVRFILDAWGSFTFSREFFHRLDRAGVQVIRYRPFSPFTGRWGWRRRDHRKLLTVDHRIGFIGGMNIGVEYLSREEGGMGIRDTHLEVQGPVVHQIKDLFSYNWNNHHHALDEYFNEPRDRSPPDCGCDPGEVCARVTGGRWKEKNAIHHEYLEQIQEAQNEIRLTQSYFLPTEDVLEALIEASNRGCRVQLLLPGTSDVPPVQYGSRYLYSRLLKSGIEIYEYMGSILHAKTAVIDNRWSTVGTYNFDYQSLFHNLEVNITVEGRQFARKMSRLFETDLGESRRVTEKHVHEWGVYERLLARFWHGCRWLL